MTTATLEAPETTTETLTETHVIPEFNYATFADGIDRMNRRAARLGVQPVQITRTLHSIQERYTNPRNTETIWQPIGTPAPNGFTTTGEQVPFWSVTIDGEYPKLPGWTAENATTAEHDDSETKLSSCSTTTPET